VKYKQRLRTFEAFQMTRENNDSNSKWPDWLLGDEEFHPGFLWSIDIDGKLTSNTSPNNIIPIAEYIYCNDWVLRDEYGRLSVCKPNLFAVKYEGADSEVD